MCWPEVRGRELRAQQTISRLGNSGSYDRDWEGGAPGLGATRRKRKAVPEAESQRRRLSQGTRVGGRCWDWVAMAASACAVGAGLAFLELVGAGGWSQS